MVVLEGCWWVSIRFVRVSVMLKISGAPWGLNRIDGFIK